MSVIRISKDKKIFIPPSSKINKIFALAKRVASYDVPVLIMGETGTGKEYLARYIYQHSSERNGPYIGLNCAAMPESMVEAILFGYEKGAFTGAVSSQSGKFEQANNGVLLLDEIGDMPLSLQAKLLRVLQEKEVERLGGKRPIPLNFRLIAATNKDLKEEVRLGRFREDLFYRLVVVPIQMPSLRERPEDILPLASYFINKYGVNHDHCITLSNKAAQLLQGYPWPGNVRELENVIHHSIIMTDSKLIQAEALGLDISITKAVISTQKQPISYINQKILSNDISEDVFVDDPQSRYSSQQSHQHLADSFIEDDLKARGRRAEYKYIIDLLEKNGGNRSKTASLLGITPRALRYRLASMREKGFIYD